jgi:hypothetical protein
MVEQRRVLQGIGLTRSFGRDETRTVALRGVSLELAAGENNENNGKQRCQEPNFNSSIRCPGPFPWVLVKKRSASAFLPPCPLLPGAVSFLPPCPLLPGAVSDRGIGLKTTTGHSGESSGWAARATASIVIAHTADP